MIAATTIDQCVTLGCGMILGAIITVTYIMLRALCKDAKQKDQEDAAELRDFEEGE